MNTSDFHEQGHQILERIKARVDGRDWESAYSLLNHGEEEQFCDLLLAMLVHEGIILRRGEMDLLRELVNSFSITQYDRDLYRYLADPGILGRIQVSDDDHPDS